MPTMYDSVDVKCPFFRSGSKRKISCEGITDECITSLIFISEAERKFHKKVFCDNRYENCEIFRMLEDKYK